MNTQERLKLLAAIADGEQRGLAEALKPYCPVWIPAAGNAGVPRRPRVALQMYIKRSNLALAAGSNDHEQSLASLLLSDLRDLERKPRGFPR